MRHGSRRGMVERSRRRGADGAGHRWGIGLFVEDGAYTTVASAVAMLMALTLVFSATFAVWSAGRSADVQVAADATALSGANAVSSYHAVATVVDASILSLGLTGFAMAGVGMVGSFVPGVRTAASKTMQAGIEMLKMRNEFAASASRGLQRLEASLPFLVAANATRTCMAQGDGAMRYTGSALAAPSTSESEFPAIEGDQIDLGDLEGASKSLGEASENLSRASEKASAEKRAAWLADCGRDGMNMQERAARLSGIGAAENPDFASSATWEPGVAIDRARAYYRWRYEHDEPMGGGVEGAADAAARRAFYGYAVRVLEGATYAETDGGVVCKVELLPRNTEEVRATELYTAPSWPTSREEAGLTLHYAEACPGARGPKGPAISLAELEGGGARECGVCHFGVGDVGRAPAASTSIDNGFEYHLREFTLALRDYAEARQRELDEQARAMGEAEVASGEFEEAIAGLSGKRPRIAPPGRDGCVAVVVSGKAEAPSSLDTPFASIGTVAERGAISAASLAPDDSADGESILSGFFSSLEARVGDGGPIGLIDSVMDVWGDLLGSYAGVSEEVDEVFTTLTERLDGIGAGPVGSWFKERLQGVVRALGIEPVDIRQRKPVLVDSALVAERSGMEGLAHLQSAVRKIPIGASDPKAILAALEYEVGEYVDSIEFVLAEIPLPWGGSFPLTVRLRDLMGPVGGGGR